jgi:hypothetical protein
MGQPGGGRARAILERQMRELEKSTVPGLRGPDRQRQSP